MVRKAPTLLWYGGIFPIPTATHGAVGRMDSCGQRLKHLKREEVLVNIG